MNPGVDMLSRLSSIPPAYSHASATTTTIKKPFAFHYITAVISGTHPENMHLLNFLKILPQQLSVICRESHDNLWVLNSAIVFKHMSWYFLCLSNRPCHFVFIYLGSHYYIYLTWIKDVYCTGTVLFQMQSLKNFLSNLRSQIDFCLMGNDFRISKLTRLHFKHVFKVGMYISCIRLEWKLNDLCQTSVQ